MSEYPEINTRWREAPNNIVYSVTDVEISVLVEDEIHPAELSARHARTAAAGDIHAPAEHHETHESNCRHQHDPLHVVSKLAHQHRTNVLQRVESVPEKCRAGNVEN